MTKKTDTIKFYSTRDSATSTLRKLGLQARDYDLFIKKLTDGSFACDVGRAEAHLNTLRNPKPKAPEVTAPVKAALAKVKGKADKRQSISATARQLILDGLTNQEVWEVLKATFNLDDTKKHYPTWYRCEMKRTGKLVP